MIICTTVISTGTSIDVGVRQVYLFSHLGNTTHTEICQMLERARRSAMLADVKYCYLPKGRMGRLCADYKYNMLSMTKVFVHPLVTSAAADIASETADTFNRHQALFYDNDDYIVNSFPPLTKEEKDKVTLDELLFARNSKQSKHTIVTHFDKNGDYDLRQTYEKNHVSNIMKVLNKLDTEDKYEYIQKWNKVFFHNPGSNQCNNNSVPTIEKVYPLVEYLKSCATTRHHDMTSLIPRESHAVAYTEIMLPILSRLWPHSRAHLYIYIYI